MRQISNMFQACAQIDRFLAGPREVALVEQITYVNRYVQTHRHT